jgi:hypothetical protein
MKNLIFVFIALMSVSCVSTKTTKVVITPAGNWDYLITGTPEGNFSGVMSIVSENNIYSAKMTASGSELTINKFTWDEPNKKLGGEFNYSGYPVLFDATMSGEEMAGSMSVEGMNFPFKATRKK